MAACYASAFDPSSHVRGDDYAPPFGGATAVLDHKEWQRIVTLARPGTAARKTAFCKSDALVDHLRPIGENCSLPKRGFL
jgi:hypothetical protein